MMAVPTADVPLRVSGASSPKALAGAVAGLLRAHGSAQVQAIGPAAVNQAVKAVAIARGYLAAEGLDLYLQPDFVKLSGPDEGRTGMVFLVRSFALEPSGT